MADDEDKIAKPETGAGPRGHEPKGQVSNDPHSEWTASDSRGPLHAAAGEEGTGPTAPDERAETQVPSGAPGEPPQAEPVSSEFPTSSPPATSLDEQPERRAAPIVPIVLALIVGAVVGAGSAALMYAYGGSGDGSQESALAARVDALEKRPDPQPELDALKSQVAAAPKPQAFDPAPLQDKLAALQSDVDALKQKKSADPALDQKVASLGGDIEALKAQGADVKGLDGKVAGLAASLDGLKKQDETQQGGLAALQSGQKALEGKVTAPALAVVADSLVQAIALGKPYATQIDALASLGADPAKVAVLRENADKGVPSAQVLAQKFAPLADPILATAVKAPPDAGLMDRLKSGMMSMVSVRRADATAGDDVGSRVSRIEADLAHDDVAGAYATWDGLPADAKAKSDAWGALAKTHVEAMGAARGLQAEAIAALGAKKS